MAPTIPHLTPPLGQVLLSAPAEQSSSGLETGPPDGRRPPEQDDEMPSGPPNATEPAG